MESTKKRASSAFKALGMLLEDHGLAEPTDKADAPATCITYLGVEFDGNASSSS